MSREIPKVKVASDVAVELTCDLLVFHLPRFGRSRLFRG